MVESPEELRARLLHRAATTGPLSYPGGNPNLRPMEEILLVGQHKPVGYLPFEPSEFGISEDELKMVLSGFGNVLRIPTAAERQKTVYRFTGEGPAEVVFVQPWYWVHAPGPLQSLLSSYTTDLQTAGWPTDAEEFMDRLVSGKFAFGVAYDVVAYAFADSRAKYWKQSNDDLLELRDRVRELGARLVANDRAAPGVPPPNTRPRPDPSAASPTTPAEHLSGPEATPCL